MKPAAAGLYVHFPFCRRKCPYCHFFSLPAETAEIRSRVEAWRKGIAAEAALFSSGRSVAGSAVHETPLVFDTLYLGGGTPSLADPGDVARLKDDLAGRLPLQPLEFTLEANPSGPENEERSDSARFRGWIRAGVTRLSVGAQSFDDGVLRVLGRPASADRTVSFVRRARDAGFDSLSLDLMAGVPGETPRSWDRTLDAVRLLRPDHVSLYFLENVEGLPFEKVLREHPADEDAAVDAFERAADALAETGLRRYEISSFALPGKECRHNFKYWRYEPFLGLGPSAASHIGAKRWANTAGFEEWRAGAAAGAVPSAEIVELDRESAAREALAAGLRLVEGIHLESFAGKFGFRPDERLRPAIESLGRDGLIVLSSGILRIPKDKLLISNAILSRLL